MRNGNDYCPSRDGAQKHLWGPDGFCICGVSSKDRDPDHYFPVSYTIRAITPPRPFGLYHSPAVDTATFERSLISADRCPDFAFHWSNHAGCTCGDPAHRFRATLYGWERTDVPTH